jgi:alcohol oxidase
VASRLAQADPTLSVLLIEGGENNANVPHVQLPALLLQHQLPGSRTAIFWQGNKSEYLAGRAPVVPTGGILGGGSSINLMLYSRAQGSDFDDLNMPGWSAKDVVPLMEKVLMSPKSLTWQRTHG